MFQNCSWNHTATFGDHEQISHLIGFPNCPKAEAGKKAWKLLSNPGVIQRKNISAPPENSGLVFDTSEFGCGLHRMWINPGCENGLCIYVGKGLEAWLSFKRDQNFKRVQEDINSNICIDTQKVSFYQRDKHLD